MDSTDWKAFHEIGKMIRLRRQEKHRLACYKFAANHGLRYTPVQEWHIRIASDNIVLDLFPKSKHYHNRTTDNRGVYHNLEGFLHSVFKNDTGKRN